jgi:hypothetical protein
MAAATFSLTPAYGQQVAEPEGMPVYRQKKSSFFQNPFSNTYQKIWNRAKSADAPVSSQPATNPHATNAGYAVDDQATVISVDGQPVPVPAPAAKFAKNRAGRILHTARKTTDAAAAQIQQGVDKVVHVKDVNEGTPAIGQEFDVQADESLIKTLANGEQILNVKERVIGIYRDGKLVPVEAIKAVPSSTQAPAAPVRKEVDPWFGDTVTAPSEEIRSGSPTEPAAPAELVPPQSESAIPVLSGEEVIETTSYTGPNGEQVTLLVPNQPTQEQIVGVQIGEEMPAPQPVRKAKGSKALAKQIIPFKK